ncbi:related to vacuolar ATP synthase subunit H [Cephalotrichum gorgonifer]|uniref:V-type proton ATPase subunit H n=1 Tax=Cephalotrichum gorgonifer TaxID=2041049 RepID=A0AAE8N2H0_9PEZI|nr:related to vacuolar ATP synthase subunit H [Cephalotrichum gorgonifer]
MFLDPPAYLASLQNNIRQRPIPWDGAVRSGIITDDQLSRIRAVDRAKKPDTKQAIVEDDVPAYASLFAGQAGRPSILESAAKQPAMLQYLLVLLSDLISCSTVFAKSLLDSDDPYRSLRPLLSHSTTPDDPIRLLTSTVLTGIIGATRDSSQATVQVLSDLLPYLSEQVRGSDASKQDIAVQQLSHVLSTPGLRSQFWGLREDTVKPMIDILGSAAGLGSQSSSASLWSGTNNQRPTGPDGQVDSGVGIELLYHVLFAVWQLSFDAKKIGDDLNDEYDIVILYSQLLKVSPKEKISRVIIATLRNLLENNEKTLLPTAVLARLPTVLGNLAGRHYADQELLEDLGVLQELLEEYTRTKTTFDEYVAEVNTGHLRWSPPHRNAMFWAENARKILEYERGELPRKISEIMAKPWDQDKAVLAIACNDIGCLVKEVPEKRHQLEKLGLKRRIMELMGDTDENVKWESLRALGAWLKYSFEG